MSTITIEGDVQTWGVGEHSRRFLNVTLPFATAVQALRPELYDAVKGKGEQRPEIKAHVKHLERQVAGGTFTPTPAAANLRRSHLKRLRFEFGRAYLDVDPAEPLALTDAQQRFAAIRSLIQAAAAAGDAEMVRQLNELPIPVVIHLDGQPQVDFINLQAGKPVEASHLLSLRVQQKMLPGKDMDAVTLAQQVAKALNADPASPFHKFVKFDARGCGPLPVTTLCARSASELGSSLVGLAKVGLAMGVKDAKALAGYVVAAWKAVSQAPGLVGEGFPLCPPPDGTRGGATLVVGLGIALAYRLKAEGRTAPEPEDLDALLEAALGAFMTPLNGSLNASEKRGMLRAFAAELLGACGPLHGGVPSELQRLLAPSAYGNPPLPKAAKAAAAEVPAPAGEAGDDPDIDFGAAEPAEAELAGSYA